MGAPGPQNLLMLNNQSLHVRSSLRLISLITRKRLYIWSWPYDQSRSRSAANFKHANLESNSHVPYAGLNEMYSAAELGGLVLSLELPLPDLPKSSSELSPISYLEPRVDKCNLLRSSAQTREYTLHGPTVGWSIRWSEDLSTTASGGKGFGGPGVGPVILSPNL
ncbi:hypothetical protein Tco_0751047 [Tanacetum coccineum]|uniref:Uncharacterized protein n=1 Tax=Tanacetum coccineum TaxID=301880 RepID=A0ABQ4Z4G5_9ASTR